LNCAMPATASVLLQNGQVQKIEATGCHRFIMRKPICGQEFQTTAGRSIFFYSDGLSEAHKNGDEYGIDRIGEVLSQFRICRPRS